MKIYQRVDKVEAREKRGQRGSIKTRWGLAWYVGA